MKKTNVKYEDLPIEYKTALLEWFYMDFQTLDEVAKACKDNLFTIEIISVEEAKKRCMDRMPDWSIYNGWTFDDFHSSYVGDGSDIPNHGNSIYPVIENNDEKDEWLLDGWHRFNSYVFYGHKEIPVLKFQ